MRSDDDFETVLDHNGRRVRILKDGGRYRVPLMFRDGINPSLTSMQRSVASRHQLDDQELASCRPGFRYGQRPAADRQAMADAKAKIYAQYDAEISRQYLTPPGLDPRTGAGSCGPRQEPPEGSLCTRNGWPGVWRRDDDGKMVCDITAAAGRADAKAQLRSRPPDEDEDDETTDDSRSVAQIAADHKVRMQRLYDELDRELESAHRNVKP
jgi:hypothetical protein